MGVLGKLKFPVVKNFHPSTVPKAFVLNAIATATVTILAVELRLYLNRVAARKIKQNIGNAYIKVHLTDGSTMKVPIAKTDIAGYVAGVPERTKLVVSMLGAFALCLLTYILLYHVFGFGGGMLCPKGRCKNMSDILTVEYLLAGALFVCLAIWAFFAPETA